jgi:hypothetical protein
MTADGKQIYCYARAAGYSLDVVRAGLEEAIVISRCERTSFGTHSMPTTGAHERYLLAVKASAGDRTAPAWPLWAPEIKLLSTCRIEHDVYDREG